MEQRILHIDLDQQYAEHLYFHLLTIGVSCHYTPSVREALIAMLDSGYDVVICETDLQTIPGPKFIRAIKALNPKLNLIVISRAGEPEMMTAAFAEGASEYLVKGLNDDRITTIINGLCATGSDMV